ncbi:MAG: hypothetical protein ABI649_06730 [Gaiellaceae bacterium]
MTRALALLAAVLALALFAAGCGKKSSGGTTEGPGTTTLAAETTVNTQTTVTTETVTVTVAPPTATEGTNNALPAGAKVLPAGGSLAARALRAATECREGKGVARLRWVPAAEPGDSQRVAVTILPEERDPRKFELVRKVSPDARSLVWTGLSGQAIHTWIVLTQHEAGWAPSARATFVGPACTADFSSP